ncbi:leucine-rich repeat extensin-like protein 5 [Aplysia californica]|uniref:Leucine-rich repeat extensin-like protein 5 n=1 Tax=Aplysia californica TaxID=6500 RepID=A0ABM0JXC8_APLCA|nr:leucine-rich repeat extensin-like protein 5 [Aplysia californica]
MSAAFQWCVVVVAVVVFFLTTPPTLVSGSSPVLYRANKIGIQLDTPPGVHDLPPDVPSPQSDYPPPESSQGRGGGGSGYNNEDRTLPLRPVLPQLNAYSPDPRDRARAESQPELKSFGERDDPIENRPPSSGRSSGVEPVSSGGYFVGSPGGKYVSPSSLQHSGGEDHTKPRVGLQGGAGPASLRGKPVEPRVHSRKPGAYTPNTPAYPPPPPVSNQPAYPAPHSPAGYKPAHNDHHGPAGYKPVHSDHHSLAGYKPAHNDHNHANQPNPYGNSNPGAYHPPAQQNLFPAAKQPGPVSQPMRPPSPPQAPSKDKTTNPISPPGIPANFPAPFAFPENLKINHKFPFPSTISFNSPRPFKNRSPSGFPSAGSVFGTGFPDPVDAKYTRRSPPVTEQQNPAPASQTGYPRYRQSPNLFCEV